MQFLLINKIIKIFKITLWGIGSIALLMLILSFTSIPFWGYYHLGQSQDSSFYQPSYIIILGSNGMPSPDGLIKCYYGAQSAKKYPQAHLIIALPSDSTPQGSKNLHLMLLELQIRGIDTTHILFEKQGFNTYRQISLIKAMLPCTALTSDILLITQPEHLCRARLTMKKAGFTHIHSAATYAGTIDEKLLDPPSEELPVEPGNLNLRYNFWNYLKLEITVLREYSAIAYYKVRGWI